MDALDDRVCFIGAARTRPRTSISVVSGGCQWRSPGNRGGIFAANDFILRNKAIGFQTKQQTNIVPNAFHQMGTRQPRLVPLDIGKGMVVGLQVVLNN